MWISPDIGQWKFTLLTEKEEVFYSETGSALTEVKGIGKRSYGKLQSTLK